MYHQWVVLERYMSPHVSICLCSSQTSNTVSVLSSLRTICINTKFLFACALILLCLALWNQCMLNNVIIFFFIYHDTAITYTWFQESAGRCFLRHRRNGSSSRYKCEPKALPSNNASQNFFCKICILWQGKEYYANIGRDMIKLQLVSVSWKRKNILLVISPSPCDKRKYTSTHTKSQVNI